MSRWSEWYDGWANIQVGDAVISKQKNVRCNHWDIARVVSVSPSADGVARSCIVETPRGVYRRPVNLLVPLTPHEKLSGGSVTSSRTWIIRIKSLWYGQFQPTLIPVFSSDWRYFSYRSKVFSNPTYRKTPLGPYSWDTRLFEYKGYLSFYMDLF